MEMSRRKVYYLTLIDKVNGNFFGEKFIKKLNLCCQFLMRNKRLSWYDTQDINFIFYSKETNDSYRKKLLGYVIIQILINCWVSMKYLLTPQRCSCAWINFSQSMQTCHTISCWVKTGFPMLVAQKEQVAVFLLVSQYLLG